ncbi:MAG TPA: PH domain-containing protein [Stellaceae bacterium]|nr:PH domain-containing protein [Stellaceae bacterium]
MSYVAKVLQPGETLLCTAKLHWFLYLHAYFALALAAAAAAAAMFVERDPEFILLALAAIMAVTGVFTWLRAWTRRTTTELAVTDHRVIYKVGLFSRHTAEMNRNKVESVDVEQTIAGRVFGYGTIILRGTGGTFESIRNVADPLSFRSFITAA